MKVLKHKRLLHIIILIAIACLIMFFYNASYNDSVMNELSQKLTEEFYKDYNMETSEPITPVTEKPVEDNDREERIAYLTFDDGPSEHTQEVLNILKEYEVKATFFVNGKDTPFARHMYQRIVKEEHALGNHTYSHNYSQIYKSVDSFFDDLLKLEKLLYRAVGVRPRIIRFPGGSTNTISRSVSGRDIMKELIQELTDAGYVYIDWNVCAFDGYNPPPIAATIAANVLKQSKNKEVVCILLHDSEFNKTTPEALPIMIEGLREMGFHFDIITPDTEPIWFY